MPRGFSINIGINRVDPLHYGNTFPTLRGCENDATLMSQIAQSQGFSALPILGASATANNIRQTIANAAQNLNAGDILLLTYSGHGSQMIDELNGDEDDGMDETLVLFDRNLIDDELYVLWSFFRPGVRILFITDSCHSGTVAQMPQIDSIEESNNADEGFFKDDDVPLNEDGSPRLVKTISGNLQNNYYFRYKSNYDHLRLSLPSHTNIIIRSSILHISACRDNQFARDGIKNSLFTEKLARTWNNGLFTGNYEDFTMTIANQTGASQIPDFKIIGAVNSQFQAQTPFLI
jgi:metacaspase-1